MASYTTNSALKLGASLTGLSGWTATLHNSDGTANASVDFSLVNMHEISAGTGTYPYTITAPLGFEVT